MYVCLEHEDILRRTERIGVNLYVTVQVHIPHSPIHVKTYQKQDEQQDGRENQLLFCYFLLAVFQDGLDVLLLVYGVELEFIHKSWKFMVQTNIPFPGNSQ